MIEPPKKAKNLNDDWLEAIPGVFVAVGKDTRAELDRLFPSPAFDTLRARYRHAFPKEQP